MTIYDTNKLGKCVARVYVRESMFSYDGLRMAGTIH